MVAIGTIEGNSEGRISVRDAVPVVGEPGERFELKRSPSNPPAFQTGARAILLLRGARSPYVLVDEPRENVAIAPADSEARWIDALRAARDALGEPTRLRDLYLAWIDGPDDALRQQALRGLYDVTAAFQPLPAEIPLARARMAVDPTRPAAVRNAAAAVAILGPEGAAALLAAVPPPSDVTDAAEVYDIALQGAMLRQLGPQLESALRRGLASRDVAVRRVAARYGAQVSLPEVRAAVAKLADSDPDPEVRKLASAARAR